MMALCSTACGVELAQTQAEIEALPNGSELLSIYPENDIETYRDVLYFTAQVLADSSASIGQGNWNSGSTERYR